MNGVDGALAGVFEVHGDPGSDGGLDLAQAPIGLAGMADKGAGLKKRLHEGFSAPGRLSFL